MRSASIPDAKDGGLFCGRRLAGLLLEALITAASVLQAKIIRTTTPTISMLFYNGHALSTGVT